MDIILISFIGVMAHYFFKVSLFIFLFQPDRKVLHNAFPVVFYLPFKSVQFQNSLSQEGKVLCNALQYSRALCNTLCATQYLICIWLFLICPCKITIMSSLCCWVHQYTSGGGICKVLRFTQMCVPFHSLCTHVSLKTQAGHWLIGCSYRKQKKKGGGDLWKNEKSLCALKNSTGSINPYPFKAKDLKGKLTQQLRHWKGNVLLSSHIERCSWRQQQAKLNQHRTEK